MKNVFLIVFCAFAVFVSGNVYGIITYDSNTLNGSYHVDNDGNSGTPFIVAGGTGSNAPRGTWDDEKGAVIIASVKITDNGARLCTIQAQCANENKKKKSWTTYHYPEGGKEGTKLSRCYTFCKDGYTAVDSECKKIETLKGFECQTVDDVKSKMINNIRMNQSDGSNIEPWIAGFNSWYIDVGDDVMERDILLGVVEFVPHGVIAAPIYLRCDREGYSDMKSFIEKLHIATSDANQYTLLCMPGYKAINASNKKAGCEPIDPTFAKCDLSKLPVCGGIDETKMDKNNHVWMIGDVAFGCRDFRCKEENYGFVAPGNLECKLCADEDGSPRFGIDNNGVCHECKTGTVFDNSKKECVNATPYSKTDMVYGKGKGKNSEGIKGESLTNQCWYYFVPSEYHACVACGIGYELQNNKCVPKQKNNS